jgi:hypothetical protein
VPLKIAFRGIDRYCERYYAKGPRRRPVRIEFCEADVLDVFDEWRRAVGVWAASDDAAAEPPSRRPALAAHIERVVSRLIAARAPALGEQVEAAVLELDRLAADARQARGHARAAIVERLAGIDRRLVDAALLHVDAARAADLRREAGEELAPFGSRMAPEARARALDAAYRRLVREAAGLPVVTYE